MIQLVYLEEKKVFPFLSLFSAPSLALFLLFAFSICPQSIAEDQPLSVPFQVLYFQVLSQLHRLPLQVLYPRPYHRTNFSKILYKFLIPAALVTSDTNTRGDNINRLFKPQNPDLYYGNLYIKCYYFCQQCRDYFEVARLLDHKYVSFAIKFLKDCI